MRDLINQWWRLGGLLGIAYVVTFVIGVIVIQGETPTVDSPMTEVRQYFGEDGKTYLIGDYIAGLGFVVFFLPFVSFLRAFLGRAEGGTEVFSRIVLVGGITLIALGGAGSIAWGALALGAAGSPEVDDSTIRALLYANAYAFGYLPVGAAVIQLPASLVIWQTRALWRWLAVFGLIISVTGLIGGAWPITRDTEGALAMLGFAAVALLNLWVLLVAIAMLLKKDAPAPITRPR